MENDNRSAYDATVSESKDLSMAKAMEILMEQIDADKKKKEESLHRPRVSVVKGVVGILAYAVSLTLCLLFCGVVPQVPGIPVINPRNMRIAIAVLFFIIFCFTVKKLLIWAILVYQRYAPSELRLACCFEPCCSEYMKLSIGKYGVIRGVIKGIGRLFRCHYPNGGVDEP